MSYEIVKVSTTEHQIVKVDTKEVVSTYTRMSSAKRGLVRLLAKETQAMIEVVEDVKRNLTEAFEQGSASADATGAAQATQGADAVAQPPTSNTGGQTSGVTAQVEESGKRKCKKKLDVLKRKQILQDLGESLPEKPSEVMKHYVSIDGSVREIPLRKGLLTAAHIDTLTVVIPRMSLFSLDEWKQAKTEDEEDELLLGKINEMIFEIFGFGFCKRGNGRNGYAKTAIMGSKADDRIQYGFFAWSGKDKQGDTLCLHITGTGVTAALDGWERRLYDWLCLNAPFAKITRCDLAHDFLNGEYTPIQAYFDWLGGGFDYKTMRPVADTIGLGWLNAPDKGRTFYVGSRKNGSRVVRVYEKGIEQGDKTSAWVRFELQLRNRDIIIPLDILLYPGEYLTAAYPICEQLFTRHTQDLGKCERVQKIQEISVEHCVHHMSIQASPTIKMLLEMGFSSDEVIQIALNPKAKKPKRLHPNAFDASYPFLDFIKENKRAPYSHELQTFVCEKYLTEQEQIRVEQLANTPQAELDKGLYEFREQMRERMYTEAAFGNRGFTREMRDWGMELDDYEMIRHGDFKGRSLLTT